MAVKGQKLSQECKEKMIESKKEKIRSKFKWDIVDPFLDVNLSISAPKRNLKFITLREFKQKIFEGKSIKDIIGEGISRHLIHFFSFFAQGRLCLSKEDFIKEYENGLALKEMAKKYKIPKDHIGFVRELYEVKKKGAKFLHRKRTEELLTDEQKQVLYGSMMGDAKKVSPSSAQFQQCADQKDYLLWKYKIFENIASKNSLKCSFSIDKRSEKELSHYHFYTHANTDIEICISHFYENNQKRITQDILDVLTPLSLAVWFMDDGQTEWGYRHIVNGITVNYSPSCVICTDSFLEEECNLIKEWFENKFNIIVSLKERSLSKRIGYRIQIRGADFKKFINLIKPYVLPSFLYKVDYDAYTGYREKKETQEVSGKLIRCPLGADFNALDPLEQDKYVSNLVAHYQKNKIYSLVEKPDKWRSHIKSVIKANPDNLIREGHIVFSNMGNKFLMSHFPNYWDAKSKGSSSPREVFENKKYLSDIIRKIISDGYYPNQQKILKSLKNYRGNQQVSGFMPCVAKAIYHRHCDEGARVIDFCGGYGGRLFGAAVCNKVGSYTCIEINFDSFSGLHDLYKTLREEAEVIKPINIINQDSILGMKQFSDQSFDFCFTSPPYFDTEIYEDSTHQSSAQYDFYGEWFEEYLIKAINEARRISKKVAINIANTGGYKIADDLRKWLDKNNIGYQEDKLRLPHYGKDHRFEPIFVF
jgi:16S rRNA G966 N2-methylase RsmD